MSQENGTVKGHVKWFSVEKQYGFIRQENNEPDVFFHATTVLNNAELDEGDVVEFTIEKGQKGLKARNVKFLQGAE